MGHEPMKICGLTFACTTARIKIYRWLTLVGLVPATDMT